MMTLAHKANKKGTKKINISKSYLKSHEIVEVKFHWEKKRKGRENKKEQKRERKKVC